MSGFSLATLYLPEWALPWVAVFAVAAWIVGARALATAAAIVLLAELVLAPMLAPWITVLPNWVLFLLLGLLALTVEHDFISLVFNREVANDVIACQLTGLVRVVLLGPFRLLGFLLRMLRGRA